MPWSESIFLTGKPRIFASCSESSTVNVKAATILDSGGFFHGKKRLLSVREEQLLAVDFEIGNGLLAFVGQQPFVPLSGQVVF